MTVIKRKSKKKKNLLSSRKTKRKNSILARIS